MNIVSYGGGTNSTALLIECVNRNIPIDLILFADTGAEKPHTYQYLKMFSKWCVENGLPEITRVQKTNRNGTAITLEGYCFERRQLPSIAYGFKSCSQKHKISPQDKFMNNWMPAKDEWSRGNKITKFVGFDADEPHRVKEYIDDKYLVEYPLIDWDMGREECVNTIRGSKLELPGKSACYFCPSTKIHEIHDLKRQYPDLAARAIALEKYAAELNTTVKGLGRDYSWENVLKQDDLFEGSNIEIDCGCYDG